MPDYIDPIAGPMKIEVTVENQTELIGLLRQLVQVINHNADVTSALIHHAHHGEWPCKEME